MSSVKKDNVKTAMFAAGCFWGVEESFRHATGVIDTEVGYAGGMSTAPTYERVCGGDTGHAETVRVFYDPTQTSYKVLLDVFWSVHDPTQVGGQGLDTGEQYRSVVFYHDKEEKMFAEKSRDRLQREKYKGRTIATEIIPVEEFYRAEEYHQQYIAKREVKK